jgi:hypothetical protein
MPHVGTDDWFGRTMARVASGLKVAHPRIDASIYENYVIYLKLDEILKSLYYST